MTFLIDAQLPPGLVWLMTELGHSAVAAREVGLRDAADEAIWDYAKAHGFIILTKDEEFAGRVLRYLPPPRVVWLRVGNCSNRALFLWLREVWPEIERRLQAGERLVEVQ